MAINRQYLLNYGEAFGLPVFRLESTMVTIEITKSGVYGQNGPIPVGTVLDVPHEPTGWANKYRVVSDSKGKTLEVATPDHTPGNVPLNEVDEHAESDDLHDLRAEFERIFGEKPHGRMKAETLRAKIEEAQ